MFTPDVEQALESFALTHDVQPFGDVVLWQRRELPHAGGVNEQPAKLLETMTFICQQKNTLLLAVQRPKAKR
jgi:hypothetical protein